MAIVHIKKNHNFRQNKALSWKAKGLLAYLVDHPRDWEVNVADLITQSDKDGRSVVQSALRELMELHYARLELLRDASGKVRGRHYVIYESPYDLTDEPRNRETGFRSLGETDEPRNRETGFRSLGEDSTSLLGDITEKQEEPTNHKTIFRLDGSTTKDLKTKTKEKPKEKKKESQATSGKAHNALLDQQAEEVLSYFNHVHGRDFQRSTFIRALLATGRVSQDDCYLVIDWLYAVDRLENPDGYKKYCTPISPFRPDNFDINREKAQRWKLNGRPTLQKPDRSKVVL